MSTTAAERLDEDDLERHRRMVVLAHQADALTQRAVELRAAFKVWCEELHERYGLAVDGSEGIAEDGTITRRANGRALEPEPIP